MPAQAQWYFDFVSPYAYLQFKRLNQVPSSLDYEMVPILF
ncbi:MAG TPA: 2-hydroxychromene-2-carboxylate isomerase, partial [Gammaproteobacteria bacterium]|nr:2-hydroxychromene-2-carboxylate isomerase [Gammaproteobacteria bacterium]